jgi:hypothetical protein
MERRTKLINKNGRVEKCRKKKNGYSLYCRSRVGEQKSTVNGWKHLASRLKYVKTDKTSTDYMFKRFNKCAEV